MIKLPWKKERVLDPLEGYNRWASTYASESNPIKDFSNQWIEKLLPDVVGSTVLDAGCGAGYFCKLLEERQAGKIAGIDFSPAMLEEARKNCRTTEFICQDISSQALKKEEFDLVLCCLVLGHIADLAPALDNLLRSLKKGGTILISDFHPFLTLSHSKRTFTSADGDTFEIQHHLHLFRDIINRFHQHQVVLERLEEPCWNGLPVIYVIKAQKM